MSPHPKLSKLEFQIIELFWDAGPQTVRDALEKFPKKSRPAYTTVQTIVSRLEGKGALRRTSKLGSAHIFEATITRGMAQRPLVEDFLGLFGGRTQPLMSHLVESGKLTIEDIREAERLLEKLKKSRKASQK